MSYATRWGEIGSPYFPLIGLNWESKQNWKGLLRILQAVIIFLYAFFRLVSASFPRHHFTHIFIDEAGHAREPECIIPVADLLDPDNPKGGQLVLAGDPKQLGPILRCKTTQEYGLGGY